MTTTVPIPRPLRGSRIDVFYPVKPENVPSLSSLDSAFQLQEYISLVIRLDVHDVDRIVSIPGKNASGEDGDSKATVDESCWIYEQLRRLAQDLTHPLITNLQNECTRQSCPEMKAGEWLYLCVAHGNDGGMEQCCAIDYILHTIDSATALLNSPRAFPSRLSIPAPSYRHFASLARRLGRIFAHAYFHHRALFEQAEAESSLYRRFEEIVARWNLVPREFLVIPTREDADLDRGEPKLAAAAVEMTILGNEDKPSQLGANISPPSEDESKSPGSGSPGRRFGRNRTDTMVFSEASAVVEELNKSSSTLPDPEQEQEQEQEQNSSVDVEMGPVGDEDEPLSDPEQQNEPLLSVDEVEQLESENPAPEQPEQVIVTPSSSTAPSDTAHEDVHLVEDSPKKEDHFAEAQASASPDENVGNESLEEEAEVAQDILLQDAEEDSKTQIPEVTEAETNVEQSLPASDQPEPPSVEIEEPAIDTVDEPSPSIAENAEENAEETSKDSVEQTPESQEAEA